MKKFIAPEIDVKSFEVEDVITTSGITGGEGNGSYGGSGGGED